ncbi:hypothetical protein [Streptococcus moroccensis]|uniref:Membrane protein YesL n=1 Tax=Streptococcus moroccensis TaxID=1451356 RepID=A0ABT9YQZ3_9STRE|nr:hypothetical protein [Streptococcus moroccensis]MDQ0222414.1 putative membrane protein YesL [Streptococcus moroccensis]
MLQIYDYMKWLSIFVILSLLVVLSTIITLGIFGVMPSLNAGMAVVEVCCEDSNRNVKDIIQLFCNEWINQIKSSGFYLFLMTVVNLLNLLILIRIPFSIIFQWWSLMVFVLSFLLNVAWLLSEAKEPKVVWIYLINNLTKVAITTVVILVTTIIVFSWISIVGILIVGLTCYILNMIRVFELERG